MGHAIIPLTAVAARKTLSQIGASRPAHITPFTGMKMLMHAPKIEAMLRGELVYPVAVEIDLSNVCPHDCPFCSFGTNATGGYRQENWQVFPGPRMLSLLDELHEVGVHSLTFTGGGEPLVHREAAAIFEKASVLGFEYGLVTNGLLLKGGIASTLAHSATFVRVSLDAGTAETHHFSHGLPAGIYQFEQIVGQMHTLRLMAEREVREAPLVLGASFCVMNENFKEIYLAAKRVRDAGADYLEVRPTFPTDWRADGCTWGSALDPDHYEAVRAELEHARLHLNSETFRIIGMTDRFENVFAEQPIKRYTECRTGPLTTVIGADGNLWHCCVQRGEAFFNQGSILDKSFKEAWDAVYRRNLRAQIDIRACPRCRYDSENEVIEHAFLADGLHKNFI